MYTAIGVQCNARFLTANGGSLIRMSLHLEFASASVASLTTSTDTSTSTSDSFHGRRQGFPPAAHFVNITLALYSVAKGQCVVGLLMKNLHVEWVKKNDKCVDKCIDNRCLFLQSAFHHQFFEFMDRRTS